MTRASRGVTAATVASVSLLAGGLLASSRPSSTTPGASPTSEVSDSTAALPVTTPAPDELGASGPATSTSTTVNPGFVDGAAASAAAEQLLTPYIASQHLAEVTEPACSEPASGEVGETFACYALKPGDLVIALRATIGSDRLISLELITDQMATTTTASTTTTTLEGTETTSA